MRLSGHMEWSANIHVDVAAAESAIAAAFPVLAGQPVRAVDAGWDVTVFRLGTDLVARFPRRTAFLGSIERELAVLPVLQGKLGVPVPLPVHVSTGTDALPYPFWCGPWLPGIELASSGLADADRAGLAGELGLILARLHGTVPEGALANLPVDPMRRGTPTVRAEMALDHLARLEEWTGSVAASPDPASPEALLGGQLPFAELRRCVEALASTPAASDPPVLIHGDLHARHVLVGPSDPVSRRISGIIDWGDCCLGDRSIDLSIAYGAFRGESRQRFLKAYGPISAETSCRARLLAINLCAALALYAADEGRRSLFTEAAEGLRRAIS